MKNNILNLISYFWCFKIQEVYKRLPRRVCKKPVRFKLVGKKSNKQIQPMHLQLRQLGYTKNDVVVVMLESDFERIAKVANTKKDNSLCSAIADMTLYMQDLKYPDKLQIDSI